MKNEIKQRVCDLHTHSCFSDGTYTPEDLILEAKGIGLSAIALTDHNTVAGLDEFITAGEKHGVEAVPGIELSTEWEGHELHILGLYIRNENYHRLLDLVKEMRERKEAAYRSCIASLNRSGYNLDYDEIAAKCQGQANRAHIARALVEGGYVSSPKEAFASLISPEGEHYRAPKYLDASEAIAFIKSIGAVAVWAHPYLSLSDDQVVRFLKIAKAEGLDAMETIYSRYDEETTALARKRAEEFGILPSGGSDFHGPLKPDVSLGIGCGSLFVPEEILERLKSRLK